MSENRSFAFSDSSDDDGKPDFSALMDSSCSYSDDCTEPSHTPLPPPPPPAPVVVAAEPITKATPKSNSNSNSNKGKKGKKRSAAEDEDEDAAFLELMNSQPTQRQGNKTNKSNQFHPQFNVAKELLSLYNDSTFEESTNLGKSPKNNKFITRLKSWPTTILTTFKVRELAGNHFEVTLSEYGQEMKKRYGQEQITAENISHYLAMLQKEKFSVPLLFTGISMSMYSREFSVSTEMILRLTWILQQTIPAKFEIGQSIFVGQTEDLQKLICNLAIFSFRRGCYSTSSSLWSFILESFQDDQVNGLLCGAIPSLYSGNISFLERILNSTRKYEGIPIDKLPDWRICYALLSNDDERLKTEIGYWRHVFFGDEISNKSNEKLSSLEMVLRKRILPYLEKADVSSRIQQFKDLPALDKTPFERAWAGFDKEIPVFAILEEAAMPVGS